MSNLILGNGNSSNNEIIFIEHDYSNFSKLLYKINLLIKFKNQKDKMLK